MGKLRVGKVYFIKSETSNLTKIGITYNDVNSRLKSLQTGNPDKLYVYRTIETMFPERMEEYFHLYFEEKRKTGEWFDISKEELDDLIDHTWLSQENGIFTVDFIDLAERNKDFEARIRVSDPVTIDEKIYIGWDTRTTNQIESLAWEAINSLLGIIKQTKKQYPKGIFRNKEE